MSNFAHRPQNSPLNLGLQLKWEKDYQKLLRKFLKAHEEFDGSAVCAWMRKKGLGDPDHHNQWATQLNYYAKLGWYIKIGVTVPTGHGHNNIAALWKRA